MDLLLYDDRLSAVATDFYDEFMDDVKIRNISESDSDLEIEVDVTGKDIEEECKSFYGEMEDSLDEMEKLKVENTKLRRESKEMSHALRVSEQLNRENKRVKDRLLMLETANAIQTMSEEDEPEHDEGNHGRKCEGLSQRNADYQMDYSSPGNPVVHRKVQFSMEHRGSEDYVKKRKPGEMGFVRHSVSDHPLGVSRLLEREISGDIVDFRQIEDIAKPKPNVQIKKLENQIKDGKLEDTVVAQKAKTADDKAKIEILKSYDILGNVTPVYSMKNMKQGDQTDDNTLLEDPKRETQIEYPTVLHTMESPRNPLSLTENPKEENLENSGQNNSTRENIFGYPMRDKANSPVEKLIPDEPDEIVSKLEPLADHSNYDNSPEDPQSNIPTDNFVEKHTIDSSRLRQNDSDEESTNDIEEFEDVGNGPTTEYNKKDKLQDHKGQEADEIGGVTQQNSVDSVDNSNQDYPMLHIQQEYLVEQPMEHIALNKVKEATSKNEVPAKRNPVSDYNLVLAKPGELQVSDDEGHFRITEHKQVEYPNLLETMGSPYRPVSLNEKEKAEHALTEQGNVVVDVIPDILFGYPIPDDVDEQVENLTSNDQNDMSTKLEPLSGHHIFDDSPEEPVSSIPIENFMVESQNLRKNESDQEMTAADAQEFEDNNGATKVTNEKHKPQDNKSQEVDKIGGVTQQNSDDSVDNSNPEYPMLHIQQEYLLEQQIGHIALDKVTEATSKNEVPAKRNPVPDYNLGLATTGKLKVSDDVGHFRIAEDKQVEYPNLLETMGSTYRKVSLSEKAKEEHALTEQGKIVVDVIPDKLFGYPIPDDVDEQVDNLTSNDQNDMSTKLEPLSGHHIFDNSPVDTESSIPIENIMVESQNLRKNESDQDMTTEDVQEFEDNNGGTKVTNEKAPETQMLKNEEPREGENATGKETEIIDELHETTDIEIKEVLLLEEKVKQYDDILDEGINSNGKRSGPCIRMETEATTVPKFVIYESGATNQKREESDDVRFEDTTQEEIKLETLNMPLCFLKNEVHKNSKEKSSSISTSDLTTSNETNDTALLQEEISHDIKSITIQQQSMDKSVPVENMMVNEEEKSLQEISSSISVANNGKKEILEVKLPDELLSHADDSTDISDDSETVGVTMRCDYLRNVPTETHAEESLDTDEDPTVSTDNEAEVEFFEEQEGTTFTLNKREVRFTTAGIAHKKQPEEDDINQLPRQPTLIKFEKNGNTVQMYIRVVEVEESCEIVGDAGAISSGVDTENHGYKLTDDWVLVNFPQKELDGFLSFMRVESNGLNKKVVARRNACILL